jgi:hypothetical protein
MEELAMFTIALVLACLLAIRVVPMVLTAIVASAFGGVIIWRCRALGWQLLAQRASNPASMPSNARPSRRQRRIAARALAWSLHRTEFRSLLPQIDPLAERIIVAVEARLTKRATRLEATVR